MSRRQKISPVERQCHGNNDDDCYDFDDDGMSCDWLNFFFFFFPSVLLGLPAVVLLLLPSLPLIHHCMNDVLSWCMEETDSAHHITAGISKWGVRRESQRSQPTTTLADRQTNRLGAKTRESPDTGAG